MCSIVKRCGYIYQDTVGLTTLMNTGIITTVITLSLYELAAGHLSAHFKTAFVASLCEPLCVDCF